MDFERTLETQRLRLLRIVAGLLFAVGVLLVGPVSRGFSVWVCRSVASVLSRAELAARYLVIAQARMMAVQRGFDWDVRLFADSQASAAASSSAPPSVAACRARLWALRAVLMNLPRYAERLLRRIQAHLRGRNPVPSLRFAPILSTALCASRRAALRIERPPDKSGFVATFFSPPSRMRVGRRWWFSRQQALPNA